MVLLQFEPADGMVVEQPVPRWRVVRMCFLVYMYTSISYTRLLGPKCIFVVITFSLVVLRHCDECVPWRSSLFAIL